MVAASYPSRVIASSPSVHALNANESSNTPGRAALIVAMSVSFRPLAMSQDLNVPPRPSGMGTSTFSVPSR